MFAGDANMISFFTKSNEIAHREEVRQLVDRYRDNSFLLTADKMKEMVVSIKKTGTTYTSQYQWQRSSLSLKRPTNASVS